MASCEVGLSRSCSLGGLPEHSLRTLGPCRVARSQAKANPQVPLLFPLGFMPEKCPSLPGPWARPCSGKYPASQEAALGAARLSAKGKHQVLRKEVGSGSCQRGRDLAFGQWPRFSLQTECS